MTIDPSGVSIAGGNASLVCSANITPNPVQNNLPSEWFFGTNNASLPSGLTPMATALGSGNTYTSTLTLSPLNQSYAGMYTCRIGGNAKLAAHITLIVNGIMYIAVCMHSLSVTT